MSSLKGGAIRGGSHLVYEQVFSRLNLGGLENLNLVLNTADPRCLKDRCINVLWTQHNWNQAPMEYLRDPSLSKRFDAFVFVSHWQCDRFRNVYPLPMQKCHILPNAVKPLHPEPRNSSDKIRLVYASTPWRGLEVLLDAFELLQRDRDDVELHIFSSTEIYGPAFHEANAKRYEPLFHRARQMPNTTFWGYQPNDVVRSVFEKAHVFAYPSIFEETSCISAIEAGSAGLDMVLTSYGALYETCAAWASYVPYQQDRKELALAYKSRLQEQISRYWTDGSQDRLNSQKQYFDYFYNMDARLAQWRDFLKSFGIDVSISQVST